MTTATQLSFDDLPALEADDELQRLGETREFGYLLLELLNHAGWDVVVTAAFAGEGVLVIARGVDGIEIKRQGAKVADVAADLFQEAMHMPRPQPTKGAST